MGDVILLVIKVMKDKGDDNPVGNISNEGYGWWILLAIKQWKIRAMIILLGIYKPLVEFDDRRWDCPTTLLQRYLVLVCTAILMCPLQTFLPRQHQFYQHYLSDRQNFYKNAYHFFLFKDGDGICILKILVLSFKCVQKLLSNTALNCFHHTLKFMKGLHHYPVSCHL